MTSTVPESAHDLERQADALRAKLAVLEEAGQALAKRLDLSAVAEVVGEKLDATFPDADLMVALYDAATNMITFAYESTAGERVHTDPLPAESGLTATVIRTRRPLLITTAAEAQQAGAVIIGGPTTESWLGVPMMAGDELVGVVALESTVPNAFDDDDMRLVSTLAASAGIALANARLIRRLAAPPGGDRAACS